MFDQLRTALIAWNQRTNERQKLQQSYIVLLMVTVFLAGLVSLFNATRSRQLMYFALALITTFVVNFIAWSLLKSTLLDKLPRTTAQTPNTNRTRTAKR